MYELHNLGWSNFQQLCHAITREILGQTVEAFLDSGDGGRDGAFAGKWRSTGQEDLTGSFVIQCKFTSRREYAIRTSDLRDEVEKAKRLVGKGHCDSYLLMTNAGVPGPRAEEIKTLFCCAGVKHVRTLGSNWITQQIRENKRLRMLVPRVYGVGDLSQILDERAYAQGRAILETLREDLAKVVITDAYRRARDALDKHRFVLIMGEPATGKTTIASLLAMAAVDQRQASVLKLDEPGKVAERWNPDEPSQFFWLDDAFGVTQYEEDLVRGWNRVLPEINTMLRRGVRIVMTSRDYIYNRARAHLKGSAFPLLKESQVVVDVKDLTAAEKRQILYNHLKLGKQSRTFREEIKPHLEDIAAHTHFSPEMARRLADPLFTSDLLIDPHHLQRFVEKREEHLLEVLEGIDTDSKAALALIYMRNDRLCSPIKLAETEVEALARLESNIGGCTTALKALNGSLVMYICSTSGSFWRFKHPTIGDAYAQILAQNPEMLSIYIQGSPVERIVDQVTCGDVGIENAVVIPKPLFPLLLAKLSELSATSAFTSPRVSAWRAEYTLRVFLSRRCSKEFVALYHQHRVDGRDRASEPALRRDEVIDLSLLEQPDQFGALPDNGKIQFFETMTNHAIVGESVNVAGKDAIHVLKQELFADSRARDSTQFQLPHETHREEVQRLLEALGRGFNTYLQSPSEAGASDKPVFSRSIFDDIDHDEDTDDE